MSAGWSYQGGVRPSRADLQAFFFTVLAANAADLESFPVDLEAKRIEQRTQGRVSF